MFDVCNICTFKLLTLPHQKQLITIIKRYERFNFNFITRYQHNQFTPDGGTRCCIISFNR